MGLNHLNCEAEEEKHIVMVCYLSVLENMTLPKKVTM